MKNTIIISIFISTLFVGCNKKKIENRSINQDKIVNSYEQPVKMIGVRNKRYCEILTISRNHLDMIATVYNSIGCNNCPEISWKNIDQEKIKKDLNAKLIIMNGPRVFLMDSIGQYSKPLPKVNLGGIEMIERAKLNVNSKQLLKGKHNSFEEQVVNRATKYVFNKGSQAYFLKHNADIFIMQSYAKIINPNLNENTLKKLTSLLKLPKGWTYQTRKLKDPIVLKTLKNGKAFLIQDNLQNSYQKIN